MTALALAFTVIVVPLVSLSYLVCWQSIDIFSHMPFTEKLEKGLDKTFRWMDKKFDLKRGQSEDIVMESLEEIKSTGAGNDAAKDSKTNGSGRVIGQGVRVSSTFLMGFFLTLIYAFLLLLYRQAIKKFFVVQFGPKTRHHAARYLMDIQRVMQGYLYGIVIVILILGSLNSIGLWVIGVDYAFFFGFLAAFLAVITFRGLSSGALPFAYAAR
ncbi:MAG: AI-2E family transporter [Saprospiraceae bacterium]|nr:AI-2E family transporter [Saprospiraceae bacterium]